MNAKRLLAIALVAMCSLAMRAAAPQYARQDSVLAESFMRRAAQKPAGTSRLLYIARLFTGVPYVAHTLEGNDDERLVVNLRQLDCTTFVETVLALYRCVEAGHTDFASYCKELQSLRYGGQEPHYTHRLHYFTSWIEANSQRGICRSVDGPNPPFTAVQRVSVNWMTTHVSAYRMLNRRRDWLPAIRHMEQRIEGKRYRYIPKAQLKNTALLRRTIKDGDIIVILTNKRGLDTQHLGFAVWHNDGLHLLNASSIHKRVIDEPMTLRQYLYKHPTMPGIRVVRLK